MAEHSNPVFASKYDQEKLYSSKENPWRVDPYELGLQQSLAEFIHNNIDFSPKLILEVGSGEGRATQSYQSIFKDSEFLGFDISETAVYRARKKRLNSIALDIENLSEHLADIIKSIDVFIIIEVLYYLDDYRKFLNFLHEHAKKGAIFCIGDSIIRFNYREYMHRNFEDVQLLNKFRIYNHTIVLDNGKQEHRYKKIFLS